MVDSEGMGVRELLGPTGTVAQRLPGYEERPEQVQLAEGIDRAFRERRHLVAEAGTGVGKSFAYLLPAVLHALRNPGRGPVVISTRTIALQQQLETSDLPFLNAVLPLEWSAVAAVGRGNYVCLRRLGMAEGDRGLFEDRARRRQLEDIATWAGQTREGTRMDLDFEPEEVVWDEVKAESGNCLHRACPHYQPCHYQRGRRRMQTAQILVVNHALYMADLALRMAGAGYLPDHQVVVFDEAHHLERVATEGLGLRIAPGTIQWHLRRLYSKKNRNSILARYGTPSTLILVQEVGMLAEQFFADLHERLHRSRARDGLALGDEVLTTPLLDALFRLSDEVSGRVMAVQKVDHRMELTARVQGLQGLHATLRKLCRGEDQDSVRWIEPGRRGPALRAAPLDVSHTLRQQLFTKQTAILVSATLGPPSDKSFGWVRGRLGIDDADTQRLGSPFDYRNNVRVVLEEAMPDPSAQADAFGRELVERTRQHVLDNGGRALILCTSWGAVRQLAEGLRPALGDEGIELLVQGDAPLTRLLARKREEPTSVLLGTDSLWEGIDVRGDALTLVIVTRFPFANPSHPLTRARLAAIESRGGKGFFEQTLPEAVLKFRQGFGRLVRSGEDQGQVVVLDPRVRTKPYGREFLQALPEGSIDSTEMDSI